MSNILSQSPHILYFWLEGVVEIVGVRLCLHLDCNEGSISIRLNCFILVYSEDEVESLSENHDLCIGGDCMEMLQQSSSTVKVIPYVKVAMLPLKVLSVAVVFGFEKSAHDDGAGICTSCPWAEGTHHHHFSIGGKGSHDVRWWHQWCWGSEAGGINHSSKWLPIFYVNWIVCWNYVTK